MPGIFAEIFPSRKAIEVFKIATLQGRSIETVMSTSSLGPKIWDILPTDFKKYCISYTIQKENSRMSPTKEIVNFIYVKHRYKTLNFC